MSFNNGVYYTVELAEIVLCICILDASPPSTSNAANQESRSSSQRTEQKSVRYQLSELSESYIDARTGPSLLCADVQAPEVKKIINSKRSIFKK